MHLKLSLGVIASTIVTLAVLAAIASAHLEVEAQAKATCTTDSDCGCTDNCLDALSVLARLLGGK